MNINYYKEIARFVRDNGITVKRFKVEGMSGGFDDYAGLRFYKGEEQFHEWVISGFKMDRVEPEELYRLIKQRFADLKLMGIGNQETLILYLEKNHLIEEGATNGN